MAASDATTVGQQDFGCSPSQMDGPKERSEPDVSATAVSATAVSAAAVSAAGVYDNKRGFIRTSVGGTAVVIR